MSLWTTLIDSIDVAAKSAAAHQLRAEGGALDLDLQGARRALAAPEETTRKLAVWVLGGRPFVEARPFLEEALSDPAAAVRLAAILALSGYKTEESAELIAGAALGEDSAAAIATLFNFGALALAPLARIAGSPVVEARVRTAALSQIAALARPGDRTAGDAALARPGDRAAVDTALVPPGHRAAVDAALASLKDVDASVRAAACRVLGAAGDPSAHPVLSAMTSDPALEVRDRAAEALRALESR